MEVISNFGPSSTPPPPIVLNVPVSVHKDVSVEDNLLVIHVNSTQPFVAKHLLPPPDINCCSYKVTVDTGDDKEAYTDSSVYVKLIGSRTCSKWVQLSKKNCSVEGKEVFQAGNADEFVVSSSYCGDILEVAVGTDLSGEAKPGWLLSGVTVSEMWTGSKSVWSFPVTKWLEATFDMSRRDFFLRNTLKAISTNGVMEEGYNMSVLSALINEDFGLVHYVLREWGFSGIKTFGWNTASRSPNQAFVATKDMQTYLIFRGSEPSHTSDWLTGFNGHVLAVDKLGSINSGFWQGIGIEAVNSIGPEILSHLEKLGLGGNLHIAGHSLGGALAGTFATFLIQNNKALWVKNINCFGMPKFGDKKLMDTLASTYHGKFHRFVYGNDIVARLPAEKSCGWAKDTNHVFADGPGTCAYLNPSNGEVQICVSTPDLNPNPTANEVESWFSAHSASHYCEALKAPIINYF